MARCVCDIASVIVWWMVDDNSYCCKLFMSWLVFLLICKVCVKRMVMHGMLKAWVKFKKMMGMQDGWGKSVGTSQKNWSFSHFFKNIFWHKLCNKPSIFALIFLESYVIHDVKIYGKVNKNSFINCFIHFYFNTKNSTNMGNLI